MTEPNTTTKVLDDVDSSVPDTQDTDLWLALRAELGRQDGGPDAMKEYLDMEASRMRQVAEQQLTKVQDR